jgi:methylmalonyl-CoA/ethylmalonyl-CoA epimerase
LSGPGVVRYLDHVGILVADADTAAGHFVQRLGMRVVHDELVSQAGARLLYLAGSDGEVPATVQLVGPVSEGPLRDHLAQHGEGLHHVCLAVADLAAALASLPAEENGRPFTGGRGRQACFLASQPASAVVELVEVGSAGPWVAP